MSSHILVTGASGFIGAALIPVLVAEGHRVRAASRRPPRRPTGRDVEWVKLPDFIGGVDWNPLLDGIDIVVHTAAIAHGRKIREDDFDQANREATATLSRSCAEKGIERLVFLSSIAAQTGYSSDHILTEMDDPCPTSPYGKTKLAAEYEIKKSGVPFTILRPVAVYGQGSKGNTSLIAQISALPLPLPFGALHNRRSLLAIENLLQAILICLKGPETQNETFIVSDSDAICIAEMFAALREAQGRSTFIFPLPPILLKALAYAVGHGALWQIFGGELVVSSQKLQKVGWKPRIDTKAGFRELFQK